MSDEKKPLKIVFAPGCFDHFDGTQEELDELLAEIQRLVESGEFLEQSRPLDLEDLAEMPDGLLDEMSEMINQITGDTPPTLH
jgi:hypothetical protein